MTRHTTAPGTARTRPLAVAALCLAALLAAPALAERLPAPDGARVYIVAPEAGATVSSPVTVIFGLEGMGVAPAGVEWDNTGHHHLIIDLTPEEIDFDVFLPATEQIRHFGGGQTQAVLDLPPGEHTLWLLLGDHDHVPHDPPLMSVPVTITVE
jgi:hypothetical protein